MILGICGYGEHGKGTASRYLSYKYGLKYSQSTSEAAAGVVFSKLAPVYGYETVEQAWDDRRNHRDEWASIIWEYNQPDGLTLYRDMLTDNEIIEGVRKEAELLALREAGILDYVIWIDASLRVPVEGAASCQVTPKLCDVTVDNNHDLHNMHQQLDYIYTNLIKGKS